MEPSKFRRLLYAISDQTAALIRPIAKRVQMSLATDIPLERQKRALASTVEFIEEHMREVKPVDSKYDLLSQAFKQADISGNRMICEFGVFQGSTINHLAGQTQKTIFGFDSFEGLPEEWDQGLAKGHFAVSRLPEVRSNVQLIKGWFNESIPPFLAKHEGMIGFLHVDCDLYSSTRTVFDLLEPRLAPDAVIVFDEYFNFPNWKEGEHKAFEEFLARTRMACGYIGFNCKSQQVATRLKARS
jgi:predicted O-methyltransferase YrrM